MAKKKKLCRCGAPMTYYKHASGWRCNQTGQRSADCNQVPVQEPDVVEPLEPEELPDA